MKIERGFRTGLTRAAGFARTCRAAAWPLTVAVLVAGCTGHRPPAAPDAAQSYSYAGNPPYNRPYRVRGRRYFPLSTAAGYRERGIASWYGAESGNRTAMGTRFEPDHLTAAHKTLPLPSRVRVTNLRNGRWVDVLVNDRGPFARGRVIDLSKGAARAIGMDGLAEVEVTAIDENDRSGGGESLGFFERLFDWGSVR